MKYSHTHPQYRATLPEIPAAKMRMMMMMKKKNVVSRIFECWESQDGGELAFFEPNKVNKEKRHLYVCDVNGRQMTHVYTIRASSWNEAMTAHHEAQGWEPYVPMEGEDSDDL